MWYFVVFQPSKCKKTHFQPQIWSIWPIFPKDSESLPKFCYIKRKNSEILSKLRNSESAGGSDALCLKISDEQIVNSTRYFTRLTIILKFWMKGCQDFSKQKNQGEWTWKKIKQEYSYGSGAEQKNIWEEIPIWSVKK